MIALTAQLVEHFTGITEVMGSNHVSLSLTFGQAFFSELLKVAQIKGVGNRKVMGSTSRWENSDFLFPSMPEK